LYGAEIQAENGAENALKMEMKFGNLACCVFAVFLLLFRASGGCFGQFAA